MVLIGPGSEWFWAALSGVVTAITLLAILRQLRMQQRAEAIEQVDAFMREFFSERLLRHQLTILTALRKGVPPTDLPTGSVAAVANFLGKIGALTRAGHLDLRNLADAGQIYQAWWATLRPYVRKMQALSGPRFFADFEWLAGRFAEADRRSGTAKLTFDDAYVADSLPRRIAICEDMIRVEQELRR